MVADVVSTGRIKEAWVLEIFHAAFIYHENGSPCTTYSIETGMGEVLPFPTNSANMFLSGTG